MHKLPIDLVRQNGSRGLVLWGLLLVSLTVGARTALAQPQITKDGTAVVLQDYARVPLSSTTTGNYPPPIDFSNQLGRANRLRSEPPNAPNSSSRFFVNDQNRNLYILDKISKTFTPYINFEEVFPNFVNVDWAAGLGTFVFDPDYAANGKFYTIHVENPSKTASAAPTNAKLPGLDLTGYTTTPAINPPAGTVIRQSILVEWTDTNINNLTFEGTAREILRVGFASVVHSVGDLLFNPSAYPGYDDYRNLYISVGDDKAGEIYGDTHIIPQRLDALGGKVLRITPDITLRPGDELSANGRYRIPTSGSNPNPFVSLSLSGLKKEIYAYGFRNPHWMSWDPVYNKLIVDDIGLDTWEEVDIITKGSNYGYAEREGIEQLLVTNNSNNGRTGSQTDPPTPFPNPDSLTVAGIPTPVTPVYPAAAYGHKDGDAISSGFVYRGSLMPQLTDKYVFGDITTGRLFYADSADLSANDDGAPTTLAGIHELQVVFDSPYDNPEQGLVNRRLFDIVADEYAHRGGSTPPNVLPSYANTTSGNDPDGVPYGGGRADIRLALGGDGEIYVLSKSDGMVRLVAGIPPITSTVTVTVQTNPTGLQITVDGAAYTAPQTFSWISGAPHTIATSSPQGGGGSRYVFAGWSDGGAISHTVAPTVNTTLTANFITQYLLTTVVSPVAGGAISKNPPSSDGYYNAATSVQLTAVPNAGYVFLNWSGDLTGSINPQSVVMSVPKTVTGNFSSLSSTGLRFVPVTPCRVADTRNANGPFGGPALVANSTRSFNVPGSSCAIPSTAIAYALNVTVVPTSGKLDYLTIWPAGQSQPVVSTLNSTDGRIKADAAIVVGGAGGAVNVYVTDETHVIIDINGYFGSPVNAPNGLLFYPLPPCRVMDTRLANGPLGGPILTGGAARSVPILSSACGLPAGAAAYSLNMTGVPPGPLNYLTAWPTGAPQPFVSTLNDDTGTAVANAAIIPAGAGGSIDVFVTQQTHLIVDVNGYFAPPGTGGLQFYALAPCRVVDTRNPNGPYGGPALSGVRTFNIAAGACAVAAGAQAFSMNATVAPFGFLGHLTLWPTGQPQPFVSTLNSWDASIVSNAAIVPGAGGSINAFSTDTTHLILDLNGFFAP